MKCGIYVRVYNEKNIIEWMEYHYKCGFDFILFYDDYSEPSVKSIIEDYGKFDKNKYLVLERLYPKIGSKPGISPGVCPNIFKDTFLPHIQKHMDYVLYIDMDEYLYMDKFNSVKELIKSYGDFDMLYIYWKFFGKNILSNNNKLIKKFINSSPNIHFSGKSICKVNSIKSSINPHFFTLKNDNNNKIIDIFNNKFNKSCDLINYKYKTEILKKTKLSKNNIYVAHYYLQDLETYINRRIIRNNKTNTNEEIKKIQIFIKEYDNIENKIDYIKKNIPYFLEQYMVYKNINNNFKKYNTDLLDFYNKS